MVCKQWKPRQKLFERKSAREWIVQHPSCVKSSTCTLHSFEEKRFIFLFARLPLEIGLVCVSSSTLVSLFCRSAEEYEISSCTTSPSHYIHRLKYGRKHREKEESWKHIKFLPEAHKIAFCALLFFIFINSFNFDCKESTRKMPWTKSDESLWVSSEFDSTIYRAAHKQLGQKFQKNIKCAFLLFLLFFSVCAYFLDDRKIYFSSFRFIHFTAHTFDSLLVLCDSTSLPPRTSIHWPRCRCNRNMSEESQRSERKPSHFTEKHTQHSSDYVVCVLL